MFALVVSADVAGQTWQERVDLNLLQSRVPTLASGGGIPISIVEATQNGLSYIDLSSSQFTATTDGPALVTGVNFFNRSGVSIAESTHARGVATQFFGNTGSMAPGANNVTHYEAINWLQSIVGIDNPSSLPPAVQPFRVQNHSWVIETYQNDSKDLAAIQRLDFMIDRDNTTVVVGTHNYSVNAASSHVHPHLMASSYNAIVVGRSDGYHARGQTATFYGDRRYKPDIVALNPQFATTSRATAMVSSAATLLYDAATDDDAANNETMKAILMAGATKAEFANFVDPLGLSATPAWDRTPTRPLDDIFGAGELNIYNSYLIQFGGQHAGVGSGAISTQAPVGSFGWDYRSAATNADGADVFYNFEIPVGSRAVELSIILAWNAKIDESSLTLASPLQNLDLHFYQSAGGVLGNEVDLSVSTVDNVEHIYQQDLPAGEYTLKVSGAANWDYGLAWRTATRFEQISADFNEDGTVDGNDFLVWQRNIGTLINAAHAQGDADGDGDVDELDLQEIRNGIAAQANPPMQAAGANAAVAAIPEPGAMALSALGACLLMVAYRGVLRRKPSLA